jgi:hypothetical protein
MATGKLSVRVPRPRPASRVRAQRPPPKRSSVEKHRLWIPKKISIIKRNTNSEIHGRTRPSRSANGMTINGSGLHHCLGAAVAQPRDAAGCCCCCCSCCCCSRHVPRPRPASRAQRPRPASAPSVPRPRPASRARAPCLLPVYLPASFY